MNARRLLTLLVVVALGVLLVSNTAVCRSDAPHSTALPWADDDGPVGGDPDDIDPEEGLGDDDNWDKAVPTDPPLNEFGAGDDGSVKSPDPQGREFLWTEDFFRVQLRILLSTWTFALGVR
jgi:hypothetical protein